MVNYQLVSGSFLQGGKYRIEKTLGQGSFGITYLATHTGLNHTVCVKEFFMNGMNTRAEDGSITGMTDGSMPYNYARKFRVEAENLARIEHPNIVRVTDFFEENGTVYYVMDFIDGENLNEYIKTHNLSLDESKSIILDIAKALQYMHEQKHMLHLDLKPGNIMRRSSDGHVFLIDFGLSKHYNEDGQPDTSTTVGLGTPGYAPTEQGNASKKGDFRPTIDVYALGATYYKLLTGETPPFASDIIDDIDIVKDKLREKNVPEQIISLIDGAMQPSAKKRTQNVAEFIAQLEGVAAVQEKKDDEKTEVAANDEKTEVVTTPPVPPVAPVPPVTPITPVAEPNDPEDDEEDAAARKKKNMLVIAFSALATIIIATLIILFATGTFKSKPANIGNDDDEEEVDDEYDDDGYYDEYDPYAYDSIDSVATYDDYYTEYADSTMPYDDDYYYY